MPAVLDCQECGNKFEAKRSDAQYCSECQTVRRKEYLRNYDRNRKDSCPSCGAQKGIRAKFCLPCENKTRVKRYEGKSNPNWREGRSRGAGYINVRIKTGSPGKGKGAFYRGEHIVVWEQTHGKPLPKGWVVHHLNGVKDDNRPENLLGTTRHRHHQHPREALVPYEDKIKELEAEVQSLKELANGSS